MREPDRIIRLKTVLTRTGLSRSTLYRKIAEGTFTLAALSFAAGSAPSYTARNLGPQGGDGPDGINYRSYGVALGRAWNGIPRWAQRDALEQDNASML